jgi:hypothetical protein
MVWLCRERERRIASIRYVSDPHATSCMEHVLMLVKQKRVGVKMGTSGNGAEALACAIKTRF